MFIHCPMYTGIVASFENKCYIVLIEKIFWNYYKPFLGNNIWQFSCASFCWSQNDVNTTVQCLRCFHQQQCVYTRAARLWTSFETTSIIAQTYFPSNLSFFTLRPSMPSDEKYPIYICTCINIYMDRERWKTTIIAVISSEYGGIVTWFTTFYFFIKWNVIL